MREKRWSIRLKLGLLLTILLGVLSLIGGLALWRLGTVTNTVQDIYDNRIAPIKMLRKVSDGYAVTDVDTMQKLRDGTINLTQALVTIQAAQKEIQSNWDRYKATYLTDKEQYLIKRAEKAMAEANAAFDETLTQAEAGDAGAITAFTTLRMYSVIEPISGLMAELKDVQDDVAQTQMQETQSEFRMVIWIAVALALTAIVISALLAWQLIEQYLQEHARAQVSATRVANVYTALSRLNHTMAGTNSIDSLAQQYADLLTDVGGLDMAYIALKTSGPSVIVGASGPMECLQLMGKHLPRELGAVSDGNEPTEVPVFARHLVRRQLATLASSAPSFQPLLDRGLACGAMFNVIRAGQVQGTLNVFSRSDDFFDPAILRALDEVANDLSKSIDFLDALQARQILEGEATLHRQQFQRVFESSPLPMVLTSYLGEKVISANPAFCARVGLTGEAMLGKPLQACDFAMDAADEQRFAREIRDRRRVSNFEAQAKLGHDTHATVLIHAEMFDLDGQLCLLRIVNDIGEHKRLIEVESANKAKSTFISRLSHELKTPLNAILGFAQLLEQNQTPALTDTQYAQVRHIYDAGLHLNTLITEMIDIGRIEAGQVSMQITALQVPASIDSVLALVQPLADKHGVSVVEAFKHRPLLHVYADSLRLRQVLLNVVSNAIKYNKTQGLVSIDVRSADDLVAIDVTDTGPGMSQAQLAELFQPFNRLGQESGDVEGSGIGLNIARELMRLMSGTITVHSEAGQGSTFTLTLPQALGMEVATGDSALITT